MLKSVGGAKGWSSAHLDCSHDRYRRSRIFVGSTAGIAGIEFWPTTGFANSPSAWSAALGFLRSLEEDDDREREQSD